VVEEGTAEVVSAETAFPEVLDAMEVQLKINLATLNAVRVKRLLLIINVKLEV